MLLQVIPFPAAEDRGRMLECPEEYLLKWREHNPQVLSQVPSQKVLSLLKFYLYLKVSWDVERGKIYRRDPRHWGQDLPGSQNAAVSLQSLFQTPLLQFARAASNSLTKGSTQFKSTDKNPSFYKEVPEQHISLLLEYMYCGCISVEQGYSHLTYTRIYFYWHHRLG